MKDVEKTTYYDKFISKFDTQWDAKNLLYTRSDSKISIRVKALYVLA